MRDYSERIQYYRQKADTEEQEAESIYDTIKYINYKLPSTYGTIGTGYFMIISLIGLFALIVTTAIEKNINFLLCRNLLLVFVFISWVICAPIHISISKKKHSVDNRYSRMPITECKIESFKTYQTVATKNMHATIYRKVASELQRREKVKNMINKGGPTKCNGNNQHCETLIQDINNRLTTFIHNDYTIFHYFESYFTWDKGKNLMEGFMCGPLFMFAWNLNNFSKDANINYSNIVFLLNLIIPCIIGIAFPLILSHINFSWDKKALTQIMSTANTNIVKLNEKPWNLKQEIDSQLEDLITEYVALLVEIEDY